MTATDPVATLHTGFSSPEASATPWTEARGRLAEANVYWLTTVRPDGRPHVTPLFGVWHDGALYFATGAEERKAKNLVGNPNCIITTGCNLLDGLDLVEGSAVRMRDEARLRSVADVWAAKYADKAGRGDDWRFEIRDGCFLGSGGNLVLVFEVRPTTACGFGKGETFSQTRWRF